MKEVTKTRPNDERELLRLDAEFFDSMTRPDITVVGERLLADDFITAFEDGRTGDKATELRNNENFGIEQISFDDVQVR